MFALRENMVYFFSYFLDELNSYGKNELTVIS